MTDIAFPAQVAKIATLADGGLRVTLDLPESAILPVAELMVCKRDGQVLDVVCKVREQGDDGTNDNRRDHTKRHY